MRVDKTSSFGLFVYPFLFDGERFDTSLETLTAARTRQFISASRDREAPSEAVQLQASTEVAKVSAMIQAESRQGAPLWETRSFPEDDLLEHVRRYLNSPEGVAPTAVLRRMNPNTLRKWLQEYAHHRESKWYLRISNNKLVEFEVSDIQLALFRTGVGLIIIEASPLSESAADWLDFCYAFRFAYGQRRVCIEIECHEKQQPTSKTTLGEIIDTIFEKSGLLFSTSSQTTTNARREREVFVPGQLIPFVVLYFDAGDIADQVPKLLYRVRNFFPSDRYIIPEAEDLRLDHPALLSYAENMWFTFSLEDGTFVAVNAPQNEFFRRSLPIHLREQYFLLFLLNLHQRFSLISISQMVSERWLQGNFTERRRAFERIRTLQLEFTARGYFNQVMQRDNHHRVYVKWREVLQIDKLYEEVREEVREMHEYTLSEQTRHLERRVNLLGALIGVPALVMAFFDMNIVGLTASEGLPIWAALLVLGLGMSLGVLVMRLLNRDFNSRR